MGKLLSGRYGSQPEAESITLSLLECNQKLNLKPSDHVSSGPPAFFETRFGSKGRYLLFLTDPSDVPPNSIWKPGYYLLPLDAKDVLSALERKRSVGEAKRDVLPIEWEEEVEASEELKHRAQNWAADSQPLFFKCSCKKLRLRLYPPWALRTKWKARLRCPAKCQPPITTIL